MAAILAMDDDDLIRSLMERLLEREGHTVISFPDAAPALETVDFSQIDLIITDLSMPTNGEQATRVIRDRGHKTPLIVLSGYVTEEKALYLKRLGAQEIIHKPFQLQEFLRIVNKLI